MRKAILGILALALASPAAATIINVPADQATVQAAINAAGPTGDEIVIAAGTHLGGLHIESKSLIIRGANPANRPVIVAAQNGTASTTGTGATTAGILIAGDGVTVTLQDLIVIPDTTSIPGRMIQTTTLTAGATITANFTNILVTGNNGSNVPSVTDPFDNTTPVGTRGTSDNFYLVNRAFTPPSLVDAVGIYTLTNVVSIAAGREGMTAYPNGIGSSLTMTGCAVARAIRNPIQFGDDNLQHTAFTITGTRANPGLLLINNPGTFSGIDVTGINAGGIVNVDHLVCINNNGPFFVGVDSILSLSLTDSLFMGTVPTASALYLNTAGTSAATVNVGGNTFFNNGLASNTQGAILFDSAVATYTIENNVVAGAGGGGVVYNGAGTGARVTLNNNGFAGAGAHALGTVELGANGPAASQVGTVTADPVFNSTTVASMGDLATAFDVSALAYDNAGTAGSDISGWGDLTTPSAIRESWQLYD